MCSHIYSLVFLHRTFSVGLLIVVVAGRPQMLPGIDAFLLYRPVVMRISALLLVVALDVIVVVVPVYLVPMKR